MSLTAKPYPKSWYAATAELLEFPQMGGDKRCDVCIVGGGYTGLTAALDLATSGLDVVLIEANKIGWGASGRNGGQFIRGLNKEPDEIAKMVGRETSQMIWDMACEANDLLVERCEEHNIDAGIRHGWIELALKKRVLEHYKHTVRVWQDYGYDKARVLSAEETKTYLNTDKQLGAFYDPGSGQLHPMKYVMGLARAARDRGVQIFTQTTANNISGEAPVICTTDTGTITAKKIVLAGNAYLGRLSPWLSRRIMPAHSYMIATEQIPEDVLDKIFVQDVAVCDSHFILNYFRRSEDNRILYGGLVSYSGLEYGVFEGWLKHSLTEYFPQLEGIKAEYFWSGCVGATMNRLPQIGKLDEDIYYAHGFSGHGVAITGLTGRLIAESITGKNERFEAFACLPALPYPGGTLLRKPLFMIGRAWMRLMDKF